MICAPGNFVRNAEFKDDTFIIVKFIKRAIDITANAKIYILPLVIAIIILISLKIYHKKKIEKEVTQENKTSTLVELVTKANNGGMNR